MTIPSSIVYQPWSMLGHLFRHLYSLRPTQVVKTFLYECSKNIVKVSLLSKENDFSFTTLE